MSSFTCKGKLRRIDTFGTHDATQNAKFLHKNVTYTPYGRESKSVRTHKRTGNHTARSQGHIILHGGFHTSRDLTARAI